MAAVVTFLIFVLSDPLIIIPAPRNPIPVTIWAAIREVEFGSTIFERWVNTIAPATTSVIVPIPVGLFFVSRSIPTRNPANIEIPIPIRNFKSFQ